MNIKQLKANYQLAELRYNSDKSETNTAVLKQAKKEYEAALKPVKSEPAKPAPKPTSPKTESPKIEQLSGENPNPETLADTETNDDASGEQQDLPEDTTNSSEPAVKEKKTEVNA